MSEAKIIEVGGYVFIVFPEEENESEETRRKKSETIRKAQEAIDAGQVIDVVSK
ncbi:MAG: hypothetical protein Q7S32_04130 [bacterium]|nr:hypothetical protein [bacterium]